MELSTESKSPANQTYRTPTLSNLGPMQAFVLGPGGPAGDGGVTEDGAS